MAGPYFAEMSAKFFSNAMNFQNIELMMRKSHRDLSDQFGSGNVDLNHGQGFVMMGKKADLLMALAPWENSRITVGGDSGMALLFWNTLTPKGALTDQDKYTYVVVAGSVFKDNSKDSLMKALAHREVFELEGGRRFPRRTKGLSVKQIIQSLKAPQDEPRTPPEPVRLERGYPPPPSDDQ